MADAPTGIADKFMENMGLSTLESIRLNAAWAVGNSNSAVRGIIGNRTPDQVLGALEKSVDDPEAKKLLQNIQGDPELAKAFHKAMAQDESFLPGMEEAMNDPSGAKNGFDLKEINRMLEDPMMGPIARKQFANTLNNVADDPKLGFDHLTKTAKDAQKLANLDVGDFMQRARGTDAERHGLIRDLLANSQIQDPQTLNMIAGIMDRVLPMIGHFFDPNGFMLKDFKEYYYVHLDGSIDATAARGSSILEGLGKKAGLTIGASPTSTAGLSAEEASEYVGSSTKLADAGSSKITMGHGGELSSKKFAAAHAGKMAEQAEPADTDPDVTMQPRPAPGGMALTMNG